MLKPQDIVILLKIIARGDLPWRYDFLAKELCMSASEVHAGFKRAERSHLADPQSKQPIIPALEEFLTHGIRYVFPAEVGELTRGIPTAYATKPFEIFLMKTQEPPPVWPFADGNMRGYSFLPLYKTVPQAAKNDEKFYELLVLVDAIRGGRARERLLAVQELKKRLNSRTS
ncbi:MAG: hypothetical protein HQM08_28650 [Candidatus Riflebacteria bacterium]|nr:hypothetical protein [Candidatus Riflebacteria bacterium]